MHATTDNLWSIKLNIAAASLYRPSIDIDNHITSIPPMLRRRLSPLARMVFQVACAVQPDCRPTRFVFGSRHGEINSCLGMLELLAQQQALSPAAFSHSVHNAIAGLWSIHHGHKGESSAISAGINTFAMACLEAQLMLADEPETPVIIVIADEKLPVLFTQFEKEPPEPYAMALLLESGHPNLQLNAKTRAQPPKTGSVSNLPACDWHSWWLSQSVEFEQAGEQHEWLWQRLP